MATADRPARRPHGSGSIRTRRPGAFELRLRTAGGTRSVTVHGTRDEAEAVLAELSGAADQAPSPAALLTLAELLRLWQAADHPWKPSTWVGYRSNARFLSGDPVGGQRAQQLTPHTVRSAVARWRAEGATDAVLAGRFRVLRTALSWAYDERLIDLHPIRYMRGPGRVPARQPLTDQEVRLLLATAETRLVEEIANDRDDPASRVRRHAAEQDLLMVRLAADSGARRGELAALRRDDLHGRVLRVQRAESAGQLTTPKSGHGRVLTLGAGTARVWQALESTWQQREPDVPLGPWLFSPDLAHQRRLTAAALGHRFAHLRDAADVPDATLHRLRHHVATFLVARGQVLQAQARLGHADAATTLREYAYALPLTDGRVADALDRHLDRPPDLAPDPAPDPENQRTRIGKSANLIQQIGELQAEIRRCRG